MALSLDTLRFLTAPSGERLLERLAGEDLADTNTLPLLTRLRRDYLPEQAGAALELARLRLKASDKFGAKAQDMFFTRDALEQASDPLIRLYRARTIAARILSMKTLEPVQVDVIDAGCGIGADSLALAQARLKILGLDVDPVRIEMARLNAAALSLNQARFEVADIRSGLPDANAVFFDPARRDEQGRRIHHVEDYRPPLALVRSWQHHLIVVKLSPGVDLPELAEYSGKVEFVSVNGDLKEALLWQGQDLDGVAATLITLERVLTWPQLAQRKSVGRETFHPVLSEPQAWLVEPDPALIRAGLVQAAVAQFRGQMLDETIAYFTTRERPDSPWVRSWKILDWMPFNLKKLRAYLRQRNIGNVTVKKRGSAVTPESLIAQLKLKGDETRILVLTRLKTQPIVIVCGE